MSMKIDQHLASAIDWAEKRLRTGAEPPWSYYRLMQLKEAATELLAGLESTSPMESSPKAEEHPETDPPHEGHIVRLDTARRHRDKEHPVLPT